MNLQENTQYLLANNRTVTLTRQRNHFNYGNFHWKSSEGRMYNDDGVYVMATTPEGKRSKYFDQYNVTGAVTYWVLPQKANYDMVVFSPAFGAEPPKLFDVSDTQVVEKFSSMLKSGVTRINVRVCDKLTTWLDPDFVEAAIAVSKLPENARWVAPVLKHYNLGLSSVDKEFLSSRKKFKSNREYREAQAMYVLFEAVFSLTED